MIQYLKKIEKSSNPTREEMREFFLDELDNKYRGIGFTRKDRNYYLYVLNKCLEVTETEYPINGVKECKITNTLCYPSNEENGIYFELIGHVGKEGRYIIGHIFDDITKYDSEIYVEFRVYRFLESGNMENFVVLTRFFLDEIDDSLIRETEYTIKKKKIIENLGENDIIKGGEKNENKRH